MTAQPSTQRFRTMPTVFPVGAHHFATRRTTGGWHARRVRDRCAPPARVTCRENSCSVFTSIVADAAVHFRSWSDVDAREKAIPERRSSSELETAPRVSGGPHRAPRAWIAAWRARSRRAGEVRGRGSSAVRSIWRGSGARTSPQDRQQPLRRGKRPSRPARIRHSNGCKRAESDRFPTGTWPLFEGSGHLSGVAEPREASKAT